MGERRSSSAGRHERALLERLGSPLEWARDPRWLVPVLVFSVCAAYFVHAGQHVDVDDDEGYYVLGGRALYQGILPYRDAFFPQMPLTTVVFGFFDWAFVSTLRGQRALNALFAAGTALLVYWAVRRRADWLAGVTAVTFFCANILVFLCLPLVKTYGLSSLLCVGALTMATTRHLTLPGAFASGALTGLAACTRLTLAPLCLVTALTPLLRPGPLADRRRAVLGILAGELVGLSPALVLAAIAPSEFWFSNVTYHALRSGGAGLVEDWGQKRQVASALVGVDGGGVGAQMMVLAATALPAAWALRRTDRSYVAFVAAAIVLAAASLLPSPTWEQYFSVVVPPLSIASALLFHRAGARGRALQAGLLSLYVLIGAVSFRDRVVRSRPVYRPETVDRVGTRLTALTAEDAVVASLWPPYLVASRRRIHPLSWNQYARGSWPTLSVKERRRYHLWIDDDWERALARGDVDAAVSGHWHDFKRALKPPRWVAHAAGPAVVWIPSPRSRHERAR